MSWDPLFPTVVFRQYITSWDFRTRILHEQDPNYDKQTFLVSRKQKLISAKNPFCISLHHSLQSVLKNRKKQMDTITNCITEESFCCNGAKRSETRLLSLNRKGGVYVPCCNVDSFCMRVCVTCVCFNIWYVCIFLTNTWYYSLLCAISPHPPCPYAVSRLRSKSDTSVHRGLLLLSQCGYNL